MVGQGRENQPIGITVLEPSSPSAPGVLEKNLADIRNRGIKVDLIPYNTDAGERLAESGVRERARLLSEALLESDFDYVVAARGGYGASDLLSQLNWQALAKVPVKIVVGFSDVSALHAALYTKLGWPGLHGPMPGSTLWGNGPDVLKLLELLSEGRPWSGHINIEPVAKTNHAGNLTGKLFGGCLSVLSNLIGTDYLPVSLSGYVLFFEDTHESAPRVLRAWNQWQDSGLLVGVVAVILGRFTSLSGEQDEDWLIQALMSRCRCPLFRSADFGHVVPNQPLVSGAQAVIVNDELAWSLS